MNKAERLQIAVQILANVRDGRSQYHGCPWNGMDEWVAVRIDMLALGLLARTGEKGLARCKFVLTPEGKAWMTRHSNVAAPAKETIAS